MGSSNTLIASLIWGSIGAGFFLYGKKQTALPATFGGLLIILASYFIENALYMSIASIVLIIAIIWLSQRGD